MRVFKVLLESRAEVAREAHVIELVLAIEGIDAVPMLGVLANDILVVLEHLAGDVLQELTNKWSRTGHVIS
jgi:hypothetical protein